MADWSMQGHRKNEATIDEKDTTKKGKNNKAGKLKNKNLGSAEGKGKGKKMNYQERLQPYAQHQQLLNVRLKVTAPEVVNFCRSCT